MKKAVIIGGGVSGIAAEKLLQKNGWSTRIVNDNDCETLPEADLIIASPGVPPLSSKLYQQAAASGIEFIGELELGYRFWKRPIHRNKRQNHHHRAGHSSAEKVRNQCGKCRKYRSPAE